MADRTHDCHGGCGAQIRFEMFACRDCWFRLPSPLRAAVNRTWASRVPFPKAYEAARTAALAWYRQNPREVPDVPVP